MIEIDKYKHFSFDVWLTLIKSHPEFKLKRAELFKNFFEINTPIEEVLLILKYYDNTCNQINEITGLNIDTLEIYLFILSRFNIKTDKKHLNDFYNESEKLFFECPPVLLSHFHKNDFQRMLDNGSTLNILSNTGFIKGHTIRAYLAERDLLDYFDFEIFSDEVNLSKPNPAIFELVEHKMKNKIDKSLILHIGDNYLSDYQGAIDYGFKAYLVKNE